MQIINGGTLGQVKLSTNGLYLIQENNHKRLYVAQNTGVPFFCAQTNGTVSFQGTTYEAFEPKQLFLHDCLHTAEEIMYQKILPFGEDVNSKIVGKPTNFGRTGANNRQVALPNRKGVNAAPDRGQAFVIVSMDTNSEYPYHAAAVVAEDKDDRVTIEVFATDQDAQNTNRTTAGDFQMYEIGSATYSFHGMWNGNAVFGDTEPCTIVIEPNKL